MAIHQPRYRHPPRQALTADEIEKTISFLTRSFSNTTGKAGKFIGFKAVNNNGATTELYDYQVDFAYLLDNIKRSPSYITPKYIQEANDLITGIKALVSTL